MNDLDKSFEDLVHTAIEAYSEFIQELRDMDGNDHDSIMQVKDSLDKLQGSGDIFMLALVLRAHPKGRCEKHA